MKTVSIHVSRKGEVTIEANGYSGPACEAVTRWGKEALGGTVTREETKPEYHEQNDQAQGQR